MVREICGSDFQELMELYTQLHDNPLPAQTPETANLWRRILEDGNYHMIVAEADGHIRASCTCIIIPNLTHGQRPYALIENVITSEAYRRRGLASACLDYARNIAERERCYKLMLMTGSKQEGIWNFYRRAGYNSEDKKAFVQWIP